ncbi:MAG: hypothetical protein LUG13_09595 [Oscillospiraceae bacterium]|nr:hypothetical protein [Oscillospiraceae bacterium]
MRVDAFLTKQREYREAITQMEPGILQQKFFPSLEGFGLTCKAPQLYHMLQTTPHILNVSDFALRQLARQLCGWIEGADMHEGQLSCINARSIVANTRSGSAAVVIMPHESSSIPSAGDFNSKQRMFQKQYLDEWRFLYILVLLQANTLAEFQAQLLRTRKYKQISSLYRKLNQFLADSYFVEATHNEMGNFLYRKWMDLFQCKTVKDEISSHIGSLDSSIRIRNADIFQSLSNWILPVVLVFTFVHTSFVELEPLLVISAKNGVTSVTVDQSPHVLLSWGLVLFAFALIWLGVHFALRRSNSKS